MPELAKEAAEVMIDDKGTGTKDSYTSSLRHWINWNLEYDEDPFEMPICPQKATLWIQQRFKENGNIKSIKTWKAVLYWLCQLSGHPPTYKKDFEYDRYVKAIQKKYKEGQDHRLPYLINHIKEFIISLWDKTGSKITYENVTRAALTTLYFCSMSRPSELVKPSGNDGKCRGLKMYHMRSFTDFEHGVPMMEFTVDLYKNQASKQIKKKIYICSTKCTHSKSCTCHWINPYNLILRMLKKRSKLVSKLRKELRKLPRNSNEYEEKSITIQNLLPTDQNYLFVHSNGSPFSIPDVKKLSIDINNINKIVDPHHFTPYSLRIGGTTRAYLSGIEHPMILKYVGWSASRLADCAQRYMRFAPYQLAQVPFKLIHPKRLRADSGKIYDPWSERLDQKYYNKQ